MKTTTTGKITLIGLFTAIAAILSALPIGIYILGVPATLQTFAMAFLGFTLGKRNGVIAIIIYILMGFVGVPVYNNFNAGPGVLFGVTGGFLFGFIPLGFLCGLTNSVKKVPLKIVLPVLGLIICHGFGSIQFSVVANMKIAASAAAVSLPYLPKDILSVFVAYMVSLSIKKALHAARIPLEL